jgi:hypothetical protein
MLADLLRAGIAERVILVLASSYPRRLTAYFPMSAHEITSQVPSPIWGEGGVSGQRKHSSYFVAGPRADEGRFQFTSYVPFHRLTRSRRSQLSAAQLAPKAWT